MLLTFITIHFIVNTKVISGKIWQIVSHTLVYVNVRGSREIDMNVKQIDVSFETVLISVITQML